MNMHYRSLLPSVRFYHFWAALFLCAFCGASNLTLAATIAVPAGGNLQAAINQSQPGDTIVLQAGASYTGGFYLPYKNGASYITIRTSTPDSDLPVGVRVTPDDAGKLAKIVTPGNGFPAIRTESAAHHYRLIGLEIMPASPQSFVYEVVSLGTSGTDQDDYSEVPHHLVIDRCFIHAWPNANFKRGIGLNSAETEITNSQVSDFHSDYQDSQAISGFNGPGPFKIINNRLEGAAENIMFGGAVPSIYELVPSNIEIRRNHLYKPWSWKPGEPGSTSYRPWIKNLFEIKNGQDIILDGNIMENNWYQADQHGTAILLTPRTEGGAVPWAVAQRITFTNNIIKNVGGGVSIVGRDNPPNQIASNNIIFRNNLFENVRNEYSVDGSRVIIVTGDHNITFDHNTILHANNFIRGYGEQTSNFVFTNNITHHGLGLWSDCGTGQNALNCYFPSNTFVKNALMGSPIGLLGNLNFYPNSEAAVGFLDYANGNYRLSNSSPYKNAGTDGKDLGADIDAIVAAINPQQPSPVPAPTPTPTPTPAPNEPLPAGVYTIAAKHSNKVLDVWGISTANGASVRQGVRNGGMNQQFVVEPLGDGLYRILARHSGKALDVSAVSTNNGAAVQQWNYANTDNQKWIIQAVGNGYYKVIAKHSNKSLDVSGASLNNGANVIQWDYWGGNNQLWKFEFIQ